MIFLYIIAFIILWEAINQDLSDVRDLRVKEMENWANTCELRKDWYYSLLQQKMMEAASASNRIRFIEDENAKLKEQIRILEFKLNPHKTAR